MPSLAGVSSSGEHPTRIIFMGDDSLGDGFRLIGFEVLPNPADEEVERLLGELCSTRQNAFVVVDQRILGANLPTLQQLLREGGRIVITAVPPLKEPTRLSSETLDRLRSVFGNAAILAMHATPSDEMRASP